jgi:hypothetical protein
MAGGSGVAPVAPVAKRPVVKVEGGGGGAAKAVNKTDDSKADDGTPLEAQVRKWVTEDSQMTVHKLWLVMAVSSMSEERKQEFIALVKRVCVVNNTAVQDDPYKDKKIIKIKPP